MDEVTGGHRRVAILDEVARPIYGEPAAARPQFQYESSFGKTLYAWRIQITPSDVAELRKQAETERLLGVLLVPVSTGHHRRRPGRVVAVGARRAARRRS